MGTGEDLRGHRGVWIHEYLDPGASQTIGAVAGDQAHNVALLEIHLICDP